MNSRAAFDVWFRLLTQTLNSGERCFITVE
jgi:hypothetical protein